MPHRRCANPVPTSGHSHSSADALRSPRGQPLAWGDRAAGQGETSFPAPHLRRVETRPKREASSASPLGASPIGGRLARGPRWPCHQGQRPSVPGSQHGCAVSPKGSGQALKKSKCTEGEAGEASRRLARKDQPHVQSAAGNNPPCRTSPADDERGGSQARRGTAAYRKWPRSKEGIRSRARGRKKGARSPL